jgi:hypothetical protein
MPDGISSFSPRRIWRKPTVTDLTQLTIDNGCEPGIEQEDYSTAKPAVAAEVVFRQHRDRLLTLITEYPYVLGCVAWLTDMRVLDALATRKGVNILVQKEDFLRPDLDGAADFAVTLRRAYDRLETVERHYAPGIAPELSYCSGAGAAIRCVGNYNADKHPAWPRMYNKFLVFCSEYKRVDVEAYDWSVEWDGDRSYPYLRPDCVWTGSYNITFNAQKSFENAVILRDPDIADAYAREWAQILALSEPLDWQARWSAPEYRIGS